SFDLAIPPLAASNGRSALPWYHVQWEKNSDGFPLESSPWDTCYLVGGTNDLMGVHCLSPSDLYQMIAEYVFLDFDPSRFGLKKRSLRPNNIDRTLRAMAHPVPDE